MRMIQETQVRFEGLHGWVSLSYEQHVGLDQGLRMRFEHAPDRQVQLNADELQSISSVIDRTFAGEMRDGEGITFVSGSERLQVLAESPEQPKDANVSMTFGDKEWGVRLARREGLRFSAVVSRLFPVEAVPTPGL